MKIKFKNALLIWFALASLVVGKDIVAENSNYYSNYFHGNLDQGKYSFIVDVYPDDAKIMIMNIEPKYKKGMALSRGKYDIKVSKKGYVTERIWIEHTDDSSKIIRLKEKN